MTSIENSLAIYLIKENYGEIAKTVASVLVAKKTYPLLLIAAELNMDKKIVAQVLSVLIDHDLAEYKLNAKQMVEYKLCVRNVLNMLKHPRYVRLMHGLFDKYAAMIVEEILLHGRVQMSALMLKLLSKIVNESSEKQRILIDTVKIDTIYTTVRDTIAKLVDEGYLERIASLDTNGHVNGSRFDEDVNLAQDANKSAKKAPLPKIPKFENNENNKYSIPNLKIDDSRRLVAIQQDYELVTIKMIKPNENFGDNDIYWKVNEKKFMQKFRDQALIDALSNRIDKNAGIILETALNICNTEIVHQKLAANAHISRPFTLIDMQKEFKNNQKFDSTFIDKYLTVILQDSFKVLDKIGDFGGGAYNVDYKKALMNLCIAHIESYIRERHGSKSLRIFRVIMDKSQLEQKQIEDYSMIPSKDCKALLYAMLNDGLLCITELSKTSDHAPSRTFYLFTVDVFQICKKLLENAYKGIKNLMIKREYLSAENKRLLEKNKKINAIIDSLKVQGADQSEIDDVRSMMTHEERNMLNCINDHTNKIDLAEIQLTETITIFENFFYYHVQTPIIKTGRSK